MSVADDGQDETRRIVRSHAARQATVLAIAGLDPSGGAGLLADARIIAAHKFHVAGVVTALTEQDSTMCSWMHPVAPEVLSNQLARLVDDLEIRAVKIGMLATAEVALAVARVLKRLVLDGVPVVLDPVLRASQGVPLLEADGPLRALLPVIELATVVTPNLDELAALAGREVRSVDDMIDAARRLLQRGPVSVLAKGGHLTGDPVDILVERTRETRYAGQRVEGPVPHGTGCALSSELACRLAIGTPLTDAVDGATQKVRALIADARVVGKGRPFL